MRARFLRRIAGDKQEPEMKAGWSERLPAQKCNFCQKDLAKGEKQICVTSCPAHALDYGDIHELQRIYPSAERLNKSDFHYAYKTDTNPCLLIKRRKPPDITEFK